MIEDLTFDRDPSINSGMPINCTVKANDNEGDSISFLFRLKGPSTGNTWLNETDWQLSNSWMCDTSNLSLGDYIINVLAKDNEHPAEMRCYASKE